MQKGSKNEESKDGNYLAMQDNNIEYPESSLLLGECIKEQPRTFNKPNTRVMDEVNDMPKCKTFSKSKKKNNVKSDANQMYAHNPNFLKHTLRGLSIKVPQKNLKEMKTYRQNQSLKQNKVSMKTFESLRLLLKKQKMNMICALI